MKKSGNSDGAKGFYQVNVDSDKGARIDCENYYDKTRELVGASVMTNKLLRKQLYEKAKKEPKFRFYSLFHHVTHEETLYEAWKKVKSNKGAPGVDGVTFKDIENREDGVFGYIRELQEELRSKKYKPKMVKRVYIPKANGKLRPLGIPTIKDRIVQQAVLFIVEPIFEADFFDISYGFRPKKSAHGAIENIEKNLKDGYRVIYDADLKGYFDTIDHDNLMKAVERRIADGSILSLIKKWLKVKIFEYDENGKSKVSQPEMGTPQGGVISPLLANIYLHHFESRFYRESSSKNIEARMVRYADDFVIMTKKPMPEFISYLEGELEGRFKLTINREKTKITDLRTIGNALEFLGYYFRYEKSRFYKYPCLSYGASKNSVKKIKAKVGEILSYKRSFQDLDGVISVLNPVLRGWSNYFSLGYKKRVYTNINYHLDLKCWKFCTRKSQRKMKLPKIGRAHV